MLKILKKFVDISSCDDVLQEKYDEAMETIAELEKENEDLEATIIEMSMDAGPSNPRDYMKEILKDVEWYDFRELPASEQEKYQSAARQLIENPVFINELNHLYQNLTLKTATSADTLERLRDYQQSIITIESLKAHFGSIATPVQVKNDVVYDEFEPV